MEIDLDRADAHHGLAPEPVVEPGAQLGLGSDTGERVDEHLGGAVEPAGGDQEIDVSVHPGARIRVGRVRERDALGHHGLDVLAGEGTGHVEHQVLDP